MTLHVKKGDNVLVIAGKDKGKSGKVLTAIPADNAVIVSGINIISKHKKPRNAQDKGGIIKQENKIDASNVQIICPVCGKATRVAHAVDEKGKKLKHIMACWFTNLDISKRHENLILYKLYNSVEYPKYDDYDVINVDKVTDIPLDYNGIMGVPITFIDKYNPEQFEILGLDDHRVQWRGKGPNLNGKTMYRRIIIKKRS